MNTPPLTGDKTDPVYMVWVDHSLTHSGRVLLLLTYKEQQF